MDYDEDDSRTGPATGQKYLWFRLKDELDPDLWGEGTYVGNPGNNYVPRKWLSARDLENVGNVGFRVDDYGQRRDKIHNPVNTFRMKFYDQVAGMTEEQGRSYSHHHGRYANAAPPGRGRLYHQSEAAL